MVDMRFGTVSHEQANANGRVGQKEDLLPADQIDVYVGLRLKGRRQELGISQGRLGRQLGLTFSQIQKYEKGSNRIGAGRLFHISAILGVPVQYFFEGLTKPAPQDQNKGEVAAAADAGRMKDLFVRISDPKAREALLSLASSMTSS